MPAQGRYAASVAKPRTVPLSFQPRLDGAGGKELRDGLSAVLRVGATLWVANDESATVERLTLDGDTAGSHLQFALGDYLELPAGRAGEIDIEGMDAADGYLYIAGSHSRKRCRPAGDGGPLRLQKLLGRVEAEENRFLLARIPLVEAGGQLVLARKTDGRRAQQLPGTRSGNVLTRRLRRDRHIGPFLGLPGKENGFDIEGLAVAGERVFLGLRGPVLRGWATVLELCLQGDGKELMLRPFDGRRQRKVRKHFLQLGGLGIRDLCRLGEDLLVLAGPTMQIDGPVRVVRWRGALRCEDPCVVPREQLQAVLELPYGDGCDHAEGIARWDEQGRQLLVVHDQPATARQQGQSTLLADLYTLPGRLQSPGPAPARA